MLFPNETDWSSWGIDHEVHRFFVLHWTELFDPDTPDTWQVRTCSCKTILRELIDAARVAEEFDAYRRVIRSLLDEAFAVCSRDTILKRYYPFVVAYLEPWRTADIGKDSVAEVERLAQVILGNLDGYWDRGVESIDHLLRTADSNRKKELYDATMNVAVEAVARGHSPRYLREEFLRHVRTSSATAFSDRVEGFSPFWQVGRERSLADSWWKG